MYPPAAKNPVRYLERVRSVQLFTSLDTRRSQSSNFRRHIFHQTLTSPESHLDACSSFQRLPSFHIHSRACLLSHYSGIARIMVLTTKTYVVRNASRFQTGQIFSRNSNLEEPQLSRRPRFRFHPLNKPGRGLGPWKWRALPLAAL